jgi:hypothetical protein
MIKLTEDILERRRREERVCVLMLIVVRLLGGL